MCGLISTTPKEFILPRIQFNTSNWCFVFDIIVHQIQVLIIPFQRAFVKILSIYSRKYLFETF